MRRTRCNVDVLGFLKPSRRRTANNSSLNARSDKSERDYAYRSAEQMEMYGDFKISRRSHQTWLFVLLKYVPPVKGRETGKEFSSIIQVRLLLIIPPQRQKALQQKTKPKPIHHPHHDLRKIRKERRGRKTRKSRLVCPFGNRRIKNPGHRRTSTDSNGQRRTTR